MPAPARDRFLDLLRSAVAGGTLTKLTLGKHRGRDGTLQNLLVRPVALKSGPHLAFVWRHADGTRTVEALITTFAEHHQLSLREAEVPVLAFLKTLTQRNLIALAVRSAGA